MDNTIYQLLSFLPIISLIIFSLAYNIRIAALISFCLTTILFILWDNSYQEYTATLISSLISTITILMIVFGALFLFSVMEDSGRIHQIKHSLKEVHPSSDVLFFFISIGLTGFFEGVAGFGTPGAIVPPILIAMGFNPLASVAIVLLFDGLAAAFGAVGTPLTAGIESPLKLTVEEVKKIGFYSAIMISLAGILFLIFSISIYNKSQKISNKLNITYLYLFFIIPFIFFSWFATDLATVLSSLIMLIVSIIYLSKGKVRISPKPWLPYIFLIILLLLPKLIPNLSSALNYEIIFNSLLRTDISSSFKPFKSPLFPFLFTGLAVLFFDNIKRVNIRPIIRKSTSVFIVLFPIIAVSQMMLNSASYRDSMITIISDSVLWTGKLYVFICPFIGLLGSFITGSTTVSNIVFAGSQLKISTYLDLDPIIILALQHSGAAIGNAVCLFNIVAAASVAGIKEENEILKKTIIPSLTGVILIGAIGMFILFV